MCTAGTARGVFRSNPCNAATGIKYQTETVYRGQGPYPLAFVLSYNSRRTDDPFPVWPGLFGALWISPLEPRVKIYQFSTPAPIIVGVKRPDGKELEFRRPVSGNRYIGDSDFADTLDRLVDGGNATTGWQYTSPDGDLTEIYNASGNLISVTNRAGLTQTITYSDSLTPPSIAPKAGLPIQLTDPMGRALGFTYNASGRISKVTDPDGKDYLLSYDLAGNLATITFPDNRVRTFHYNEPANTGGADLPNQLTGITDENGDRFATWQYDSQGRVIAGEHSGGAERASFQYNGDGSTTVTDAFNQARVHDFQRILGVKKNTDITGPVGAPGDPASQTYDANGYPQSSTDWNGNKTCYTYNGRGLEESRVEGLPSSAACPFSGTLPPDARRITTEWHVTWRLPTRIAEPKRITTLVYHGDAGASCGTPGAVCSRAVQATNDANGAQGFSASSVGTPRTWAYTYDPNGQVLTMDGPRTDASDVTAYTYYPNNDPDSGKRGNLATIANALGHTTQVTAYNLHGQPLTIVDPNGLTTTLTYDARQRLTSRTVGSETTSYEYDGVGQMTKVTLPDGSFLSYSYDPAHRLTGMEDNLGNRIAYILDAMGNRTREDVLDPGSQLARTRSRVYSNLNRLVQEIGGTTSAAQVTSYAYDNQGNLTSTTDPLSRVTVSAYDALNRLKQVTDPASGVTAYAYDGLDQLVSVSDPRSNVTAYALDGLGNLSQQSSPDTGTSASTHDAAGNLSTSTDAKGQSMSYTYDALNRVTRIVYNQATGAQLKQVDYAYDQGANAIGRLSSMTETSAAGAVLQTTTYGYDPHGRVVSESRDIGGQTYATAYAYDATGRMTGMTYPSGRTTSYAFDGLGRVNRIETTGAGQTEVVVQDVAYHPFGAPEAFTFGNLQAYGRGFDLDGRIATHTLGDQTKVLTFDAASRITRIERQGVPMNFADYGYDALDRLTSAVLPTSTYGFGYDPVGNRLSKTIGGNTDTYTYGPTSNRLATISGSSGNRTYVHDANGSITGDGVNTFGYDARGRLVSSVSAAGTTSYQVNALGQRVRKSSSLGDTVFDYDTQGRLIAESTAAGALLREYIWLGDQPVAMFLPQVAQGAEVVVDNTDAGFSATGTWPASTAVSGYLGANYQAHEANGAPPGALVVDNTDSGFSVTGIWPTSTAVSGFLGTNYQVHAANGEPPSAIVADNASGSATGTWPSSTSVGGYYGTNYQVHAAGTGASVFTWTLGVPAPGTYQVYARWTQHPNRATNAKYTVNHSAGATVATVNQGLGGGQWSLLGTFSFAAGSTAISLSDDANGYVIADAVMLAPAGAPPNTATWTLSVPTTGNYAVFARWTEHPNRATDAKYTVNHAAGATQVTVNQQQGMGAWNLLGTFSFNAGAATVTLTDQANGYVIADAVSLTPAGATANSAIWTPNVAQAGQYQVFARWTQHPNRATNATYTMTHAGGTTPVTVDQQQNGGVWNSLGTFTLGPGTTHKVTLTDQANGYVVADAVRFVPLGGQQTGTAIYYVHTDHLNTPRVLTNQAQQVVWRWENQEPFGRSLPEENPSGLGTLTFNLRFPGQYFDPETGLFYNYRRDYDPQIGRYVQSDPIGLRGGLNPYLYVGGNPISFADPTGLAWWWDELFKGGLESGAKIAGRQAGARIGAELCQSGTPLDFRTLCFTRCLEQTVPPGSGLASDFQDGCQIECVRAVSKCRKPQSSGLVCQDPGS